MVEAHTSGTPVGIVMASSDVHDDNGVTVGHEAKITFGGGDNGAVAHGAAVLLQLPMRLTRRTLSIQAESASLSATYAQTRSL